MATIKRIFLTGAPGSYWSRIDHFLRRCHTFHNDNTDINENRNWNGHRGAYWNPGNEPGYDWILNFASYSKEHIIETLDSVFDPIPDNVDTIVRVHKSHYFSYHLDKIYELFPDDAIVLVRQENYKCFLWWEIGGGHDTKFDSYDYYQRDYGLIWNEIVNQNMAIDRFIETHNLEKKYPTLKMLKENFGELNPEFVEWITRPNLINLDGVDSLIALKEEEWYKKYGVGLSRDLYLSIIPWS
jgi:hypothetical protein